MTICTFIVVISIISLPFHALMIKVLIWDVRLALPRHRIVLCLSLSDALQIFVSFSCVVVVRIFDFIKCSGPCSVTVYIFHFNIAMTLVVSSLAITLLSVERYVACIHSFRLHDIFTSKRMIYSTLCAWIIGVIVGAVTVGLAANESKLVTVEDNKHLKILSFLFIFPTSIFVSGIQYRLLVFSWKKLVRVRPGTVCGSEDEVDDFRKKQIKVAFVAGIAAIAYMVCLLPIGYSSFHDIVAGTISSAQAQTITKALAFVNNFANPCIYGIGIVDTRRALLKNLKGITDGFCHTC